MRMYFKLIEKENLVIINSNFEHIPNIYTLSNIKKVINKYKEIYKKPVLFYCMSENFCNNIDIIYQNYSWKLYNRKTKSPDYEKIKYKFNYLCGTPRPDKLAVLSKLYTCNLLDQCLWSCGTIIYKSLFNLFDFSNLPKIPKVLDLDISLNKKNKTIFSSINKNLYESSYFSLVQETEMSNITNRYTEKTFKCFWMKHPFLVAGNYQVLKLLKKDGFKTFHPFINESYDNIINKTKRIDAIVSEVDRLCKKNEKEWDLFLDNVKPILKHNYEIAKSRNIFL